MAEALVERCRQGLITVRTVLEDHTKTRNIGTGVGVHYQVNNSGIIICDATYTSSVTFSIDEICDL